MLDYTGNKTLSTLIRLVKAYVSYYFVRKETGKGLSTEDFTTAQKTKLAGIESGAQINVLTTVKVNGAALQPDSAKAVNVDLAPYATRASVPTKVGQLTNDMEYQTAAQVQATIAAQETLTAAEIDSILTM